MAAVAENHMVEPEPFFDVGSWSNDLHEVLLAKTNQQAAAAPRDEMADGGAPSLSSYMSDGESPDNTPVSSDVEDASPKPTHTHGTRRRLKRTFKEANESGLMSRSSSASSLAHSVHSEYCDDEERVVPLKESDVNDEFVKRALAEDSKDAKLEAFPILFQKAKSILRSRDHEYDENGAINAWLSAFTNDDKTGRPLPHACQELLSIATEEVALARQRQRETKTHRRSLIQNQVDEGFVCNAHNCNKRYTTAEGLRLHIRNHHEVDKKWICHAPDCTSERAFVRQADLRMHLIRMHSPVRPFPCRVPGCTKTFACHSELRRHIGSEHHDLVLNLLDALNESR